MSRLSAIALAHSLLNSSSCFCIFAFFSSLHFWQFCNCTTRPLWQLPKYGRFFRFAVGHVHYVLRQCWRVVPCEVACDRAKASPGFTPASSGHVFLLIPSCTIYNLSLRFQSSVHLKQTTQSLVKDWGKVLHSLNLELALEAQSVTKRRKAFSSWWDNQLLSGSLNAMTVGSCSSWALPHLKKKTPAANLGLSENSGFSYPNHPF